MNPCKRVRQNWTAVQLKLSVRSGESKYTAVQFCPTLSSPQAVGIIVTDEAHFSAAASYRTITNYFSEALLCYFTGSKFRSDSQPLPHVHYTEVEDSDEFGRNVVRYAPVADYEFTVQDAWRLNPSPIKM